MSDPRLVCLLGILLLVAQAPAAEITEDFESHTATGETTPPASLTFVNAKATGTPPAGTVVVIR